MLGLPKSTEILKQLPKKAIYQKFMLKSAQRDHFDADISKLVLVNAISPNTLPVLKKGEYVDSIYVLDVLLKKKEYDEKNILLLNRLIPQKILYVLHINDEIKLSIFHAKMISSDWMKASSECLTLNGTTTDKVWENIVKHVGSIEVEEGKTLTEQIDFDEAHSRLKKQVEELEAKTRSEKQPRKKLEMYEELLELRNKYNERF